jgi:hypothetical protein
MTGERQSAETALSTEQVQRDATLVMSFVPANTPEHAALGRLFAAAIRAARAALPASTEDVERLGRLAATPISRWRSTDQEWFVESFPIEFIEGHDWDVDYREFARWLAARLA